MDLSRVYFLGELGLLNLLRKHKWLPVVKAQEITYFRSIKPMQCFEVQTRLLAWEGKYMYVEQKLMVGDKVCAVGLIKGLFRGQGKTIPAQEVIDLVDTNGSSPEPNEVIRNLDSLIELKEKSLNLR